MPETCLAYTHCPVPCTQNLQAAHCHHSWRAWCPGGSLELWIPADCPTAQRTRTRALIFTLYFVSAHRPHRRYNDRDETEVEEHGDKGQQLGAAWADALQRHTGDAQPRLEPRAARASARDSWASPHRWRVALAGNNARWYYPHWVRAHYKETCVNGGAQQTDDTILENYNKNMKNLKGDLFHGGRRKSSKMWEVKILVEDRDEEGNGLGTFSQRKYLRKAPMADLEALTRKSAIGKRIARSKPCTQLHSKKLRAGRLLKS
eukprot:3528037-Prymnesium_polylepis.1